jgi:ADP-ribose pyrophosphatase
MGFGGAPMKPLKSEVAFATPWFQVLGKTMREGEAPYYSLKLPDYSAIVAITDEQRVLIVRQYRPAVEHHTLELPSGLVDAGETPAEAARRELLEETGYEAAKVELLGGMEPDNGRLGNRIWSCLAKGVRRVEGRVPEEGIEVLTWSLEELSQAIVDGRFDHALHVAVVMIAVLKGGVALS